MKRDDLLSDGPRDAALTLVLAHGAGAPMDSPFMDAIAEGVAGAGVRVVRFEFPYMAARRAGKKTGPDREAVLRRCWMDVIALLGGGAKLVIGGKSLGGRIASLLADEVRARGLVCLGYPFHPPGQPDKLRTEQLLKLKTPALIVQGERDPFGPWVEVEAMKLSPTVHLQWISAGDHSFKSPARAGRSEAQNLAEAAAAVVKFLRSITT